MEKYTVAMRAALQSGRPDMAQMHRWIERFICGTNASQNVVGHRDPPLERRRGKNRTAPELLCVA